MTFPLPAITKAITGWLSGAAHSRFQRKLSFRPLVDDGRGDIPIINLWFRCTNGGSRMTDAAVWCWDRSYAALALPARLAQSLQHVVVNSLPHPWHTLFHIQAE